MKTKKARTIEEVICDMYPSGSLISFIENGRLIVPPDLYKKAKEISEKEQEMAVYDSGLGN